MSCYIYMQALSSSHLLQCTLVNSCSVLIIFFRPPIRMCQNSRKPSRCIYMMTILIWEAMHGGTFIFEGLWHCKSNKIFIQRNAAIYLERCLKPVRAIDYSKHWQ